ncbi:RNA polymerase-associated protein RapA [Cobetia sp. D5]|uniref:RNA polymerase-associated protein RapA n=1 Tax=Cobetia sp. D5 TaxID=3105867 RepID=UPI002D7A3560|nr:RNA polymerase-associated protein RapA [Cobetia sp. D5]
MSDFIPGQRWISDGEADLGLGTILNVDFRTVTVLFAASEETRTYSLREAPLTRVAFGNGDRIQSDDGEWLIVDDFKEVRGQIVYICERSGEHAGELIELPEARLNDKMQFNQARDRLLTGQVDRNDWFDLRYRTLRHFHRVEQSPALGLSGPKVDLVPHQLYIADEVSRRHAPRVLLADEVGLGKTIEAGLILHRLLLSGRASRALILVPASLTHQWLVEMLRRFALDVSLLDEEQCKAYGTRNPFEGNQIILASQDWLFANPSRQIQAAACDWDMLIVDEAHHLDWSEDKVGPGYACVESLARQTAGVLLLTATPEQMGLESHFARLRLLDPERYHDIERFKAEEQGYVAVASAIDALEALPADQSGLDSLASVLDDSDSRALLDTLMDSDADDAQRDSARRQLRDQLLDRHGTGRVMFRNSRTHVAGFPERRLHVHELELPSSYRRVVRKLERDEDYLDDLLIETGMNHPEVVLFLDEMYRSLPDDRMNAEPWWQIDPRVMWLLETLTDLGNEKALVICHTADTARELSEGLRVLGGVHAPVFHEGMSLVERDRAAAAFASEEEGVQLLVCSEIGSEGRNFQFCHHLVMFDLPVHPDQLEQRIGRLDRIGQQFPIEIHVPVFEGSPGAQLLRWYRDGMDAFSAPHGIGSELYAQFGDELEEALLDSEEIDSIIEQTRERFDALQEERQSGRNRLLELNACRHERAEEVIAAIETLDNDKALPGYLERAFDIFGIESRDLGDGITYLAPGPHMLDGLPGLVKGEEGFSVTSDRATALSREDVQHLSWEHPLVREMLVRILDGSMGNTALALLKHPAIPGGRLMTEVVFRTQSTAPRGLRLGRFLPPTAIRVLLDETGSNLSDKVSFGGLAKNLKPVKKAVARDLIKQSHATLRKLMSDAEQEAERELPTIVEQAQQQMREQLSAELARLEALASHNPAVREEELEALRQERAALDGAIETTRLRLDSVRVIVTVDAHER